MPNSPLAQLSEKWFGRATRLRQAMVTVGTISTRLAQNAPHRFLLMAVNLSANTGAVGWDNQVTTANGLPIPANGGGIELTAEEDGELVGYELVGVNAVAAGDWLVLEVLAL